MTSSESIGDTFHRLNIIVISLKSLGKELIVVEQVQKILSNLLQSWEAYVTTIREAKDLETLQIDQLMGSLLTHEIERKGGPIITPKTTQPKNKSIALKATSFEVISSDSNSFSNDELAMFSRKFRKFFRNNK